MLRIDKNKILLSLTLSVTILFSSLEFCLANEQIDDNIKPLVNVSTEKQQVSQVIKNAPALALKIDRKNIYQLPRNFRTGNDEFVGITKDGIVPTRKGMEKLNVSASSAFSERELQAILDKIPVTPDKFYDIDLRGESHGYINGIAVSWFAPHNWGNDGRSQDLIEGIEKKQLNEVKQSETNLVYQFDDDKNVLLTPIEINANEVKTEKQLIKKYGANYFRLTLSDHFRPNDDDVDKFLTFYKSLPEDAWLHYHCYAGMGRTTIFMVMHDILKNAQAVSFKDIIQRQKLIGIVDLSEIPDKKKNWGRKAYIERYQFTQHFYDYVKANPTLKKSWSDWAKEHNYETYTPDRSGYIWRMDSENKTQLPRNFRTMKSKYKPLKDKYNLDTNYMPTRKGLDTLYQSGSAVFSKNEFDVLVDEIDKQAKGPVYVIDLRQESHGLINGNAVSWYGDRDWSNIDKNRNDIIKDEKKRLKNIKGKTIITGKINSNITKSVKTITVKDIMTEEDLVKSAGWNYVRITATDHIWPSAECIDQFIDLYKVLPQEAWVHFHCAAGEGRTTAYMAMYDMMKNPDVSLKDILYRQALLGGNYVAYRISDPKADEWKADYYNQKADMIEQFYQYVQENHGNDFTISWSQWLANQDD